MQEHPYSVEERIRQYVGQLTVPREQFGNWPICPFAKKALLTKNITILVEDDELFSMADAAADDFSKYNTEIVIVASTRVDLYTPRLVHDYVAKGRNVYRSRDLYMLYDHMDLPEYINDVQISNTFCAMILIQEYGRLKEAAELLDKAGYDNHWKQTPEELSKTDTSFFFKEVWPMMKGK